MKTAISMFTGAALAVLGFFLISPPEVGAVGSVIGYPLNFHSAWQITADFVPSTDTNVITQTAYVFHISLTNKTGSAVTCTILDKQATPREYFGTVSIAANTTYDDNPNGRTFLNGISWSCNTASAVIGTIHGKYF